MKGVILCAGEGTRMRSDLPKVLLPINGTPLLHHVIHMWEASVENFIFVLGYKWTEIIKYLPKDSIYVFQDTQKGIADAILQVEPLVDNEPFIVALGDCIQRGKWTMPTALYGMGIGVWRTDNLEEINKSYLVTFAPGENRIEEVREKPSLTHLAGMAYCGMGTYFFNGKVFEYIRKTPISSLRNEVEITDTLQVMLDSGEPITPVEFKGEYLNITYPSDIKKAEEILS